MVYMHTSTHTCIKEVSMFSPSKKGKGPGKNVPYRIQKASKKTVLNVD